jgi:hypothetical protein
MTAYAVAPGPMYTGRKPIQMQRRPLGDSLAEPRWHGLRTFANLTTGKG